jgi:Predicted dehydrogenases and related proteins
MTTLAIVGTGFVADYYVTTLANHRELKLAGVFDRDPERLRRFSAHYGLRAYSSLEDCLSDAAIGIVVNLTSPESHYAVTCAALAAGKHVYCEKPLGMCAEEVADIAARAEKAGLRVFSAPANALSDAHALVARLIAEGRIGTPRLAYAEMEDGPVFRDNWRDWRSVSGTPWPGVHEFEIGCTLEHAGYGLSWLISLFGPVEEVQAFSALTFPDKGPGTEGLTLGPDFSVGCLIFGSGVVARLTCGLAAPRDRSLTILGDAGTIVVRDLWDHRSPVHLSRFGEKKPFLARLAGWFERRSGRVLPFRMTEGRVVPYERPSSARALPAYPSQIDFAAGIAAMARAIAGESVPAFGDARARHLTEVSLALSRGAGRVRPTTTF